MAEVGARSWGPVGEGAFDGGFAVCLELEVHVFHECYSGVGEGGGLDGVSVDYGKSSSWFVQAVLVLDCVSRWDSGGYVWCRCGVQLDLGEEKEVLSVGVDEVPDLGGVLAE